MKIFIATVLFLMGAQFLCAQVNSENALGIRLGENDGFGVEVTYQVRVSEMNRVEANVGFRDSNNYNAWKITALYEWVWYIDNGFNWYAGFGTSLGTWSAGKNHKNADEDGLFINADGVVGIEYIFDIPLLLSFDFRPEIELAGNFGKSTDFDLGLSIRYLF